MSVSIDSERVRRVLGEKSDAELTTMWQDHDPRRVAARSLRGPKEILSERGIPIPEMSQREESSIATAHRRAGNWIDSVSRVVALVFCAGGIAVFGCGTASQAPRITRDLLEDRILSGLADCLLGVYLIHQALSA